LIDTSRKVLYYENDNILALEGMRRDTLVIVINDTDTLKSDNGAILYRPLKLESQGRCKVAVYHRGELMGSEIFTLEFAPDFSLQIGPICKKTYTIDNLIAYPKLDIVDSTFIRRSEDFRINNFTIANYTLTLVQNDKGLQISDTIYPGIDTIEVTDPISGETTIEIHQRTDKSYTKVFTRDYISPEHIQILKQAKKGDSLIISNIRVIGPDSRLRYLNSLTLIKE